MENATDALVMAASVLLFMIALSIAISSFSTLKNHVDEIVTAKETIDLATNSDGSYINYFQAKENGDVRTVGPETVMSSVKRVIREPYSVYIQGKDGTILSALSQYDREIANIPIDSSTNMLEFSITGKNYQNINEDVMQQLYNAIKDKQFEEYLGIYQTNEDKASVNKQTYRTITFIEK